MPALVCRPRCFLFHIRSSFLSLPFSPFVSVFPPVDITQTFSIVTKMFLLMY